MSDFGYAGKILRVDLSTGQHRILDEGSRLGDPAISAAGLVTWTTGAAVTVNRGMNRREMNAIVQVTINRASR